jgi:CRISPR system Cascade subunit CasB
MAENPRRHPYFWERHIDADGAWRRSGPTAKSERPTGEELAALRRGIGREAGTVPELWPYYETENPDHLGRRGLVSDGLVAEHIALSLYGLHQQSQEKPMHKPGRGLGTAVRRLRGRDAFSADAIDRRFNAAATSSTQHELTLHLRSLVTLLRGQEIALDYTQVVEDLARWSWDDGRSRTRRRWGSDYFGWSKPATDEETTDSPSDTATAVH